MATEKRKIQSKHGSFQTVWQSGSKSSITSDSIVDLEEYTSVVGKPQKIGLLVK